MTRSTYLPQLYGDIIIPDVVFSEMTAANAPATLRQWAENLPGWLTIQTVAIETAKLQQTNFRVSSKLIQTLLSQKVPPPV
ncbi:hypothetical protein [Thermoleptolyngbya sp.]